MRSQFQFSQKSCNSAGDEGVRIIVERKNIFLVNDSRSIATLLRLGARKAFEISLVQTIQAAITGRSPTLAEGGITWRLMLTYGRQQLPGSQKASRKSMRTPSLRNIVEADAPPIPSRRAFPSAPRRLFLIDDLPKSRLGAVPSR